MKKLLIILLSLIIFTGCWSATELSDMAIATAIGVDLVDDQIIITLQVLNPAEVAGNEEKTSRTAITNYTIQGDTLFEAIRKLTATSPRKIFVSHIRTVIFGEALAIEGIVDTLDFLMRDHELRADFMIAVAREATAEEVLSIMTPLEKISAERVYTSIKASEEFWAPSKEVKLNELANAIITEGKDAVITGLAIVGDEEKGKTIENVESTVPYASLFVENMSVFSGDQLVGWLNEEESKGFNFITNNIDNTIESISWKGSDDISLEITKHQSKISTRLDGELIVEISSKMVVNIADVETDVSFESQDTLHEIEQRFAKTIEALMLASIETAKDFHVDIFGFGEQLRRDHPREWEANYKEDWLDHFEDCKVRFDTEVDIRHGGMITDPIYPEVDKANGLEE
ncbi:Ger(x)C family spore germination protein [Amphibacillus cookii]|uniref:Ger(x)C family spore germination protein n=1 Tax=Amphibacillus cookii TaxID=767787 RepID=UPI00195AA5F5|nr:Ger(x)C family spore germination protein [Amphibacillus cookii]MBM7540070.1 spore germination protein KC [Amphibacillus cookii]